MLSDLLAGSRARILALARDKFAPLAGSGHDDAAAEHQLSKLYQRLMRRVESEARCPHGGSRAEEAGGLFQAAYGYVALCQSVVETAQALRVEISPSERRALRRGLELAISEAAPEHKGTSRDAADFDEAARMGLLVHDLRNALACVFVAHAMSKKAPGASNALLERNLQNMRSMLERASIEVRRQKEPMSRRVHNRLTRAP